MTDNKHIIQQQRLVDIRQVSVMLSITIAYFLLSYLLTGVRSDQVFLALLVNLLYFISFNTRQLIKGFSVFIIYWVIFDYMKAFPNYWFNLVHIEDLYKAEKRIFGIPNGNTILTPNEYLRLHENPFLNVLTGIFYLTWIPVPLGFAVYLFYKNRLDFYRFSFTFLLVNLIGFVIYYVYPAAPPWYVEYYGFRFIPHTLGNVGGLSRFDIYCHVSIFKSIYAKSSNVFAAMPSLHSSYPVIVLYYALKNRVGKMSWLFGLVMVGIWCSAVYNSHHYVLDVLLGIACALLSIVLFNWLWNWNKKRKISCFGVSIEFYN